MPLCRRSSGGLWLTALTLTAFTLQTDDFVIVGVLPSIADGLSTGEAAAGQLVTVFSVICAVVAPAAAVLTASWPRRRLLTGGMLVFCAANLAVPLATSFAALMAAFAGRRPARGVSGHRSSFPVRAAGPRPGHGHGGADGRRRRRRPGRAGSWASPPWSSCASPCRTWHRRPRLGWVNAFVRLAVLP
ncbi:MFS transporter [Spirillospora sp. CA-128828]|uniref:MFS transporter n=1 Tax=Spirillospora sp. CA-128828 TaxID=3240033 RepID=UPI003D92A919